VELLKQGQYKPMHVADQVISIFAGTRGFLDDLPVNRVREFEERLLIFVHDHHPELRDEIIRTGDLSEAASARLKQVIGDFKQQFVSAPAAQAAAYG